MGANKAEQVLENKLVNKVIDIERQLLQLKTVQPIGAAGLTVITVPTTFTSTGPLTIGAGARASFTVTITFNPAIVTLATFQFTIYVDTFTAGFELPYGTSLSASQLQTRFTQWDDYASATTTTRTFRVLIENYSASSHDYYLKSRVYIPNTGAV